MFFPNQPAFLASAMALYKILERAIAEAKNAGWLGKNILNSGYDLEQIGRAHV